MAIPLELLKDTLGRAPCFCVYSGAGLHKTLSIATLPGPVKMYDIEGGSATVAPWIRRFRNISSSKWRIFTDEDRTRAFDALREDRREYCQRVICVPPFPLIDVIYVDSMAADSREVMKMDVANFDVAHYNSVVVDSIHELSQAAQTGEKGVGGELDVMHVKKWAPVQEHTAIILRKLRNYRDAGIFVYLTSSEEIEKDYVIDPRSTPAGQTPDVPYSIKGGTAMPGKLAGKIPHLVDVLLHGKPMSGKPFWVSKLEALPGGSAHWETKDRFGRLEDICPPCFWRICDMLYGKEIREKIYAVGDEACLNPVG